jgi:hypothetical protein
MKSFLVSFIIIAIATGCYSPYADESLTIKPTSEDVVGNYEFDFQTVDNSLDKEELQKSRLIINSDGTFEIVKLPALDTVKPRTYKWVLTSPSGTWTIETIETIDFGAGGLKQHWGLILDSAPEELKYAGLMGKEKPIGIMFTFGDPDSGEVVMLKKK